MKQQTYRQTDINGGFYTVAEAARLLGMSNYQRVSRWLRPTSTGGDPVIVRDYQKIGREHELSFLDLIEVKFVEHFRQKDISLQSLRVAATNARRELGVSHPFASSSAKFQSDRKRIFLDTAKEVGDRQLLNLMTNQVEMYEMIEATFDRDLEFDVDGYARLWKPVPSLAPNVLVSPIFAFGRPVISNRRLPTRTIYESWLANDRVVTVVGDWFRIADAEVVEAIRFEERSLH
jgi:uncharacterized protein (DUF433 family)